MKASVIVLASVLILGCTQEADQSKKVNELQNAVSSLNTTIQKLETRIALLENDGQVLRNSFESLRERAPITSAQLSTAQNGFTVISTRFGPITFSLDDVRPFGKGSKIHIVIGNLSAADLDGVTFNISYYKDNNYFTKPISLADRILSGKWNKVSFPVEGLPADQFSSIFVGEFSAKAVYLR